MKRRVARATVSMKSSKTARTRESTSAVRSGTVVAEIKKRDGKASICIIRGVGGIGDILMTTPALRHLKKMFPKTKITYAVDMHRAGSTYRDLISNAPFIDEIIDARYIDRAKYHAVCDISAVCIRFESSGLPPVNRIDLFARALGIAHMGNKLPFYKAETSERIWAEGLLKKYKDAGKKIVVLHTASFEGKRSWPAERNVELVKLGDTNIVFVVFDFNSVYGDWAKFDNVVDMSRTSVREMAAIIEQADLFVGPDSGPMHIAGATQTKSLVIFGSIPPEARINYYPTHSAIKLDGLSCLGCWYTACPISVKCMTDLSAKNVHIKVANLLGGQ
jgi:ADP-heptose:LPS heptosyltransferase